MARITSTRHITKIFWNVDNWLPEKYDDPFYVNVSIAESLAKRYLYGPSIRAYGDAEKFTDDVIDKYEMYTGFCAFMATRGSEHERLNMMLVDLIMLASGQHRESKLVVITKLSQDSEMICRVLGSLRQRDCRVLLALPEVDVATSFGINVFDFDKQGEFSSRIPIWLCPNLLDQDQQGYEKQHSKSYFIEPPTPDTHTIDFTMPTNVDTCVFWDVEDYPLPSGLPLSMFYDNIKSAVHSRVPISSGGVSIYAYVVKEEEHARNYDEDASGIKITVVRNAPADKFARLAKITMDFLLWSMDNPAERPGPQSRPNLLVFSKLLEGDMLSVRYILRVFNRRGHNVWLALPAEKIPPPSPSDVYDLPLLPWEAVSTINKKWEEQEQEQEQRMID